jgi:hypothetical protein
MDYINGIYGEGTIKMVRLGKRSGLMVARVEGAKVAKGKVLTFLDSHVSPQEGWLQVLMHRVSQDKRHVVMPIIDGLSQVMIVLPPPPLPPPLLLPPPPPLLRCCC